MVKESKKIKKQADVRGKDILVLIPHSSVKRPSEIKPSNLSEFQSELLHSNDSETDRGSEKLYDFRKILNNNQLIFPYSQIYLNVCRRPTNLDESCPIDIRGMNVYKQPPSRELRKSLIRKYSVKYYDEIAKFHGDVIFNGHTTTTGHSSLKKKLRHQIVVSNVSMPHGVERKFCPDDLIKQYVSELRKRLPGISIGVNSAYMEVDEYICDKFGWTGDGHKGTPIIHQETDEILYIKNNKLNIKKINHLRDSFAAALQTAVSKYVASKKNK